MKKPSLNEYATTRLIESLEAKIRDSRAFLAQDGIRPTESLIVTTQMEMLEQVLEQIQWEIKTEERAAAKRGA